MRTASAAALVAATLTFVDSVECLAQGCAATGQTCSTCGPSYAGCDPWQWPFGWYTGCSPLHCICHGALPDYSTHWDDWANCSCQGAYKYPVPPLYTYHWRGQYSAESMTDYHSPWRFPPLKPYVPEPAPGEDRYYVEPEHEEEPGKASQERGILEGTSLPGTSAPKRVIRPPLSTNRSVRERSGAASRSGRYY